jgi:hypothetical protein
LTHPWHRDLKCTTRLVDTGKIKKNYFIKPNKLTYGFPFWKTPTLLKERREKITLHWIFYNGFGGYVIRMVLGNFIGF